MSQADLFPAFSIDMTRINEAVERMKVAHRQLQVAATIYRVTEHAEEAAPGWKERAIGYVRAYAEQHTFMLCEHCRTFAELDGFKAPIDGRAWGGIMRLAAKRGIIVADGYAPADSSNRSPKVRWRSMVHTNAI